MKAVWFDGKLKVREIERPKRKKGEVLVKVSCAGICNTDHEILKGYIPNFSGIPGHEFFGYVEDADDRSLIGKRVTAEINCACGRCEFCKKGLGRHCNRRTVLGIINRNGAMAEYVSVPKENIFKIPPSISDAQAIFIEPLAAAIEILEQVKINKSRKVLLIGDGKLALLIAHVIHKTGCKLTVVGKHKNKLKYLNEIGVRTFLLDSFKPSLFDIVVEASGNPSAFSLGLSCLKPRGIFVLKSTYADGFKFNPSLIVVNEITLIGSRCGRFEKAINFLKKYKPDLEKLISKEFPIEQAEDAFRYSAQPGALKVVLEL